MAFHMNWYCYAIYGDRPKPIYYVADQEDVTELETLRMKERLVINPNDREALAFLSVLQEWKTGLASAPSSKNKRNAGLCPPRQ
jgi:hypothetical protein